MAYDCCGGKRKHLPGCPFAGTGPTPEKPKLRKRYCSDTWGPNDRSTKIHRLHTCVYEEAHRGAHKCFCGDTC